jgi:hypothetical protein
MPREVSNAMGVITHTLPMHLTIFAALKNQFDIPFGEDILKRLYFFSLSAKAGTNLTICTEHIRADSLD